METTLDNRYEINGRPNPISSAKESFLEIDVICELLEKDCPTMSLKYFLATYKRYIAISADRNKSSNIAELSSETLSLISNEIFLLSFSLHSDFDFNEDLQLYKSAHKSDILEIVLKKEKENENAKELERKILAKKTPSEFYAESLKSDELCKKLRQKIANNHMNNVKNFLVEMSDVKAEILNSVHNKVIRFKMDNRYFLEVTDCNTHMKFFVSRLSLRVTKDNYGKPLFSVIGFFNCYNGNHVNIMQTSCYDFADEFKRNIMMALYDGLLECPQNDSMYDWG